MANRADVEKAIILLTETRNIYAESANGFRLLADSLDEADRKREALELATEMDGRANGTDRTIQNLKALL